MNTALAQSEESKNFLIQQENASQMPDDVAVALLSDLFADMVLRKIETE